MAFLAWGEAYDRECAAYTAARKAHFTYRRIEYRLRDRLGERSVSHAALMVAPARTRPTLPV